MKIYAYEVRQDEMGYFKEYEKKYGVSVVLNHQVPTLENADNVDGCIGVTILGQGDINAKLLNKKSATLLMVSDSFIYPDKLSSLEREQGLDNLITLALETSLKL